MGESAGERGGSRDECCDAALAGEDVDCAREKLRQERDLVCGGGVGAICERATRGWAMVYASEDAGPPCSSSTESWCGSMSGSSVDVSVRIKVNSGGDTASVVDSSTESGASVGKVARLSDFGFCLKMFFIVRVDGACFTKFAKS